jgi:hypothetical protein
VFYSFSFYFFFNFKLESRLSMRPCCCFVLFFSHEYKYIYINQNKSNTHTLIARFKQAGVISEPVITEHTIRSKDEVLVGASDGVFSVLHSKEVMATIEGFIFEAKSLLLFFSSFFSFRYTYIHIICVWGGEGEEEEERERTFGRYPPFRKWCFIFFILFILSFLLCVYKN